MVDNPEYKGEWKPKEIPNPAYKGPWVHPKIANPEYAPNPLLYRYEDIGALGFDLWQVKSGTIFDNIIVTDDVAEAEAFAKETFEVTKVAERKLKDEQDDAKKKEEEAKQAEESPKEDDDDEDEDEEEVEEEDEVEEAKDDVKDDVADAAAEDSAEGEEPPPTTESHDEL